MYFPVRLPNRLRSRSNPPGRVVGYGDMTLVGNGDMGSFEIELVRMVAHPETLGAAKFFVRAVGKDSPIFVLPLQFNAAKKVRRLI